MAAIRRIGAAVANLLLAAQGLAVVSVGWAMMPLALLWGGHNDSAREPWIEALHTFQIKITVAFLAAGLVVCFLQVSQGFQKKPSDSINPRVTGAGRLLLACGLALLPIWVLTSSAPWTALWREGVDLLDSLDVWRTVGSGDDPFGLSVPLIFAVLLLPGLQLATATSFLIASLAVLLLLFAGKRHPTRALIQCVLVQGAFLYATFCGIELFDRLSEPIQQLLSGAPSIQSTSAQAWVLERQEQAKIGARHLSWQFVGYMFLVPLSVLVRDRLSTAEVPSGLTDHNQHGNSPTRSYDQPLSLAQQPRQQDPLARATVTERAIPELRHLTYVVRSTARAIFSFMPGPHSYEISGPAFDADECVLFYTAHSGGTTRLEKRGSGAIATIYPKGFLLPAVFEIAAVDGQLLGTLKRNGFLRPTWLLFDDQSYRVGTVRLVRLGIGHARYEVEVQGQTTATLTWGLRRFLYPEVVVDFCPDEQGRLDRRLGLALAVVLESKARFWAQLHNS